MAKSQTGNTERQAVVEAERDASGSQGEGRRSKDRAQVQQPTPQDGVRRQAGQDDRERIQETAQEGARNGTAPENIAQPEAPQAANEVAAARGTNAGEETHGQDGRNRRPNCFLTSNEIILDPNHYQCLACRKVLNKQNEDLLKLKQEMDRREVACAVREENPAENREARLRYLTARTREAERKMTKVIRKELVQAGLKLVPTFERSLRHWRRSPDYVYGMDVSAEQSKIIAEQEELHLRELLKRIIDMDRGEPGPLVRVRSDIVGANVSEYLLERDVKAQLIRMKPGRSDDGGEEMMVADESEMDDRVYKGQFPDETISMYHLFRKPFPISVTPAENPDNGAGGDGDGPGADARGEAVDGNVTEGQNAVVDGHGDTDREGAADRQDGGGGGQGPEGTNDEKMRNFWWVHIPYNNMQVRQPKSALCLATKGIISG